MMVKNEFISIILPVFNGEVYLAEAIESILNQTYTHFELIIVNDYSTDESGTIAESFQKRDSRIKIIHNQMNKMLPASLNIGHRAAKGDYLTWTSHDNILKPFFLEVLLKHIEKSGVSMVYSNYDIIDKNGIIIRDHTTGPSNQLLFGNLIGASFLYKKEVFANLSGYDESLFLVEDYDFWLRAAALYPLYHINENLYQYRLQDQSLTNAIHSLKKTTKAHKERLTAMFSSLAETLNWEKVTLNFVLSIHLNNDFDFNSYFKYSDIIKRDIGSYTNIQSDGFPEFTGIHLFLRSQLKKHKKNQNLKTLIKTLWWERLVFFNSSFSKKETIKLFFKTLF